MAAHIRNSIQKLLIIAFLVIICISIACAAQNSISDKRLCADRDCKVTISKARALASHPSQSNPLFLSFKAGEIIYIKSKSAGANPNLWGGEVNGHTGFFPKNFVKELQVIIDRPQFEVETQQGFFNNARETPQREERRQPLYTEDQHETGAKVDDLLKEEPGQQESQEEKQEAPEANKKDETEVDETELPDSGEDAEPLASAEYESKEESPAVSEAQEKQPDVNDQASAGEASAAQEEHDDTEISEDDEEEEEEDAEDVEAEDPDKYEEFEDDEWFDEELEVEDLRPERSRHDTAGSKSVLSGFFSGLQELNSFLKKKLSSDTSKDETAEAKEKVFVQTQEGEQKDEPKKDMPPPEDESEPPEPARESTSGKSGEESFSKNKDVVTFTMDEEEEDGENADDIPLIDPTSGEKVVSDRRQNQHTSEEMAPKDVSQPGQDEEKNDQRKEEKEDRMPQVDDGTQGENTDNAEVKEKEEEEQESLKDFGGKGNLEGSYDEETTGERKATTEDRSQETAQVEENSEGDGRLEDEAKVGEMKEDDSEPEDDVQVEESKEHDDGVSEEPRDKMNEKNDGEDALKENDIEGAPMEEDKNLDIKEKTEDRKEEESKQEDTSIQNKEDRKEEEDKQEDITTQNKEDRKEEEDITIQNKEDRKEEEDKQEAAVEKEVDNTKESEHQPKEKMGEEEDKITLSEKKQMLYESETAERESFDLKLKEQLQEKESIDKFFIEDHKKDEHEGENVKKEEVDVKGDGDKWDASTEALESDSGVRKETVQPSHSAESQPIMSHSAAESPEPLQSNLPPPHYQETVGKDDPLSNLESSDYEMPIQSSALETPQLETQPTAAIDSHMINSTTAVEVDIKTTEQAKMTDEDKQKTDNPDGMVTINEKGTQIILDQFGNLLTARDAETSVESPSESLQPSTFSGAAAEGSFAQENAQVLEKVLPTASPEPVEFSSTMLPVMSKEQGEETEQTKDTNSPNQNNTDSLKVEANIGDISLGQNQVNEVYQSSEFNSRKVLSVNQGQPAQGGQQPQQAINPESVAAQATPATQDVKPDATSDVPIQSSQRSPLDDIMSSKIYTDRTMDDLLAEVPDEEVLEERRKTEERMNLQEEEEVVYSSQHSIQEGESTLPPPMEIPEPPTEKSSDTYETEHVFSRKIDDEKLYAQEEEQLAEATPGFAKSVMKMLDANTKLIIEKLPPSVQSLLEQEPLGLSPNMVVMVTMVSFVLLTVVTCSSCFSSDGKKKKLKASIDVIKEMEAKLQLAVKERENLEDQIEENQAENIRLKEDIGKLKKDTGNHHSELQTVKLHNESLKKQVAELKHEVAEQKDSATSKQGEAKQINKKSKELEKKVKTLEEKERKLEQETEKLNSDLKHKDQEVEALLSKVDGLVEQIGHLETSKEQLLSEAEDWKEKVTDLKERLEQREEEFKQMQESASFKESELEVLKDCFLQLKAFEEEEADGENSDVTSADIQAKLKAMMDVSKVNASLLAVEEEKDLLANRLKIESEARLELEEQLENSRKSVETSMTDKMKAERQCQEAQTKLNVLSSYFKEKELQLQRELGEQEALKKQNLNKLVNADEASRTVQQEMEVVRTQNESLKRELASSERDFRAQIAANEKKAHENWLAARSAERELKEARHEAGVLRQKLTDIERRQIMGPGGLIRPLPTRGMPPPGMMNGPPPPGMERPSSRGALPPLPLPHMRDDDFMSSPRSDRGDRPPPMDRRGPLPPGVRPPGPDARSPPPRMPPYGDARSPPPRMPPPGMMDGRSPPPYDRRPPPPHLMDRRSPPFRLPPPEMMMPPPMRGGPMPPHMSRGMNSPPLGPDSPRSDSRQDGRYPGPPYGRNPPHPPGGMTSPRQQGQPSPRQQQSQV